MVNRICPPGWNRVNVSENLGATGVAPLAPVDTSLFMVSIQEQFIFKSGYDGKCVVDEKVLRRFSN